jgi:4-aminobutyrate aminotransferase-like enzyme
MWGVEMVEDELAGDRSPNTELTGRVFEAGKTEEVLLGKGGRFGNVFRIAPPMLISEEEIDIGLERFDRALAAGGAR